MIVSLSGRKGAGKTLLAQELISQGYIKISFADRLKELVAALYGWTSEDLLSPEKKEEKLEASVAWDEEANKRLSEMIGATKPLNDTYVQFNTRRHALQYIGSEVLRSYDSDFHVNSIKNRIDPEKNYVMDDCRFKNELDLLKELGAICIFIVRPYNMDYSNHQSEVSLKRTDFDMVLLNDSDMKQIIERFQSLMSIIKITKHPFQFDHIRPYYNSDGFLTATISSALFAGILTFYGVKNCLISCRGMVANTGLEKWLGIPEDLQINEIDDPFVIDDLKLWDIKESDLNSEVMLLSPRMEVKVSVPDIIKDDETLIESWREGLMLAKLHYS